MVLNQFPEFLNRELNSDSCFGSGSSAHFLRSWIIPCLVRMLTACVGFV